MISSLNIKQTDFQFEEAYTDGQLNSILDRLNSKSESEVKSVKSI